MMAEQAKWYVIHTYSGYEQMVKDTLEKLSENNNLQDQILDIKIPMEETLEEKKDGSKKVVMRKILPGYVFVKLVLSNDLWFLITNTRGVTSFVGPHGRASALSQDEVKRMRLESHVDVVDFAKGDKIRIVSGPLDAVMGEITDLNVASQKAKVKVLMFNTETEVEVDFVQIQKLN
jgi:transcriptional antiterminator NusG